MVLPMLVLAVLVTSSLATSPVAPPRKPPTTTPPIKPCPETLCGKNEQYVRNSNACQLTCANRLVQPKCGTCKPFTGCVCKQGLVRLNDDATGPCVTTDKCPPICPKNEHYVKNSNVCEKSCDNRNKYNVIGPCQAYSKCVCNSGLVRLRKDGPCVKEDQCPPDTKCPPGEHYLNNTHLCEKTCGNRKIYHVMGPCSLHSQCVCDKGLIRLDGGPCAPEDQCPPSDISCGKDEEWTPVKVTCPPETCATKGLAVPCPHPPPDYMPVPGCKCRYGYLRDANNKCIRIEDCPPTTNCPTGEHYANNTVLCEKTCDNRKIFHIMGPCFPYSKCVCDPGLIRLKIDGPCAPEDQCPPSDISCGKDEEWTSSKVTCPPETCANKDLPVPCAPPPVDYVPEPGCKCRSGYLRDSNDKCIPIEDCPPHPVLPVCTGPNEVASENARVCPPQICESLHKGYVCLPREPVPGCNCIDNYYRNDSNICVPAEECPPAKEPVISCPENEVLSDEKILCPPQSCESIYTSYACPANQTKKAGCNCIDGYLRDSNDVCIPSEKCPPPKPICGENEIYTDRKYSCPPQSCEAASGLINYLCANVEPEPGCICKENHWRDANDVCIPLEECPPGPVLQIICGPNEVESDRKIICPPQSCDAIGRAYRCPPIDPKKSQRGCNCIKGYVRNSKGVCIPKEECPKKCRIEESCRRTCENRDNPSCVPLPPPEKNIDGCECLPEYILEDVNGKCILQQDCPMPSCPKNEVFSRCKVECPLHYCPVTDVPLQGILICDPPYPCPSGCTCQPGFLRKSYEEPICIEAPTCPPVNCTRPNEEWNPIPPTCIAESCEDAINPKPCLNAAVNYVPRCMCKQGFYRNASNVCIPVNQCPGYGNCGANATYKECPSACPPTCEQPGPGVVCNKMCLEKGCECNPGYVLHKGKCIEWKDCPHPTCPANETYAYCKAGCPTNYCPTSDSRAVIACSPPYPCPPGCICEGGYKRKSYKDPSCIKYSDCPPVKCTRPNEVWNPTPPNCVADKCSDLTNPQPCNKPYPNYTPQCVCQKGYYRNASDVCVPANKCPGYGNCGANATYKDCPSACPRTCEQPGPGAVCNKMCLEKGCECNPGYVLHEGKCIEWKDCPHPSCAANETYVYCKAGCPTDYCPTTDGGPIVACMPPYPCPPGCVCQAGYKKKSRNEPGCIKISDCPPVKCKRPNEVWNPTPPNCIADKCTDLTNPQPCNKPYPNYTPQCMCKEGFYRNSANICVPANQCAGVTCPANETYSQCGVECPTVYCPSTDSRAQFACSIAYPCPPGCICQPGYRRKSAKDRTCVKPSDCPPVTCTRPNEEWNPSPPDCIRDSCDDVLNPRPCPYPYPSDPQCMCKQGYYRNASDICVPVMECGLSCPANQEFVYCNVECPNDYCPADDSRAMIACDPPYPCPPGCSCAAGYKRKSETDRTCIKASECPPVKCTRPNEVWNPTPPNCVMERCEDYVTPTPCDWNFPNYSPQCMCREGYYRNESEICIPASECTEKCPIPERCRPTCAVPNPKNCPPVSPATTNVDGCQCQSGYVLSAEGKCVKIEECPQDQSCNGDPHARIMACPWACPATCSSPQASTCDKKCETVGCTCESGYILSKKNGKCILPDKCPAGNPCGPNGTFVDCGFRCPNQYCPQDDSGVVYACKPGRPCPPGCACKINHLRKDYDDDRCILASECPPVDCTKPNEVWNSCPSDCLSEQCENVNDPPAVCNTLLLNCQPKCVCADNHYRNSSGICIPANDCPIPPNTCESDCTPTCAVPDPPNCPPNSDLKKPCCENGYILSEKGGKCIPISHCPKTGCNGDPNAVIRRCPAPCVLSTCSNPESQGCPTICNPSCECAPGYILSSINGKCIKVDQCPGGDPCGPNARFVNCKSSCPTDYCPTDDSRARVICETFPFAPCFSGCVCNLNHKLNNREEKKCIVSSDCPPVNCTRPNEEWNSCPSDCQSEYCDAAYDEPVVCNTLVLNCQPRCVCKKNHYRDENDICIPRSECPLEECEEKK